MLRLVSYLACGLHCSEQSLKIQKLIYLIAKNVALAGVKTVTIYDPSAVEIADLGTQFFLREEDIGRPRAEVTAPRLAELNSYVPIKILPGAGEITPEMIEPYQIVVLTNATVRKQVEIDEYCRQKGIYFIAADVRGLFGSVFNDFGKDFACVDPTGENPLSGMIVEIDEVGRYFLIPKNICSSSLYRMRMLLLPVLTKRDMDLKTATLSLSLRLRVWRV